MKKTIGSIVAVAGLAAAATAQPSTELRYEVRIFNAGNNTGWGSTVNALPGDTVEVRAVVSLIDGGTIGGGLKQIVFQPVLSGGLNWNIGQAGAPAGGDTLIYQNVTAATSTNNQGNGVGPLGGTRSTPVGIVPDAPGAYGRLSPWGANATTTSTFLRGHLGTGTAAGLIRIAQNTITNWIGVGATSGTTANNNVNGGGGVSVAQISAPSRIASDPAYEAGQTNLVVFKFGIVLSADTNLRTITIDTPANGFGRTLSGTSYVNNTQWFNSPNSGDTDLTRTGAVAVRGLINIVPAPGALALLGLGGLVAARRRR